MPVKTISFPIIQALPVCHNSRVNLIDTCLEWLSVFGETKRTGETKWQNELAKRSGETKYEFSRNWLLLVID